MAVIKDIFKTLVGISVIVLWLSTGYLFAHIVAPSPPAIEDGLLLVLASSFLGACLVTVLVLVLFGVIMMSHEIGNSLIGSSRDR